MIDTVINIGKLYREAPDAHKYHEQIKNVFSEVENLKKQNDQNGDKVKAVYYEIPVEIEDSTIKIKIDNCTLIDDEDKQKSLFRLNFKTSSQDTTSKYLFGDIVHSYVNEKKRNGLINADDKGSFKLYSKSDGDIIHNNSFEKCKEYAKNVSNEIISNFRVEFERNKDAIFQLLKKNQITIIHFSFNKKHWFQIPDIIDFVDANMAHDFAEFNELAGGYVLTKSLYKSLIGGEHDYYGGVPDFNRVRNAYKGRTFSIDQLLNLIYAKNAYSHPTINCGGYKINVIPYGEGIDKDILEEFYNRDYKSTREELIKESQLKTELTNSNLFDDFVLPMLDEKFHNKTKFHITLIKFNSTKKSYEDFIRIGTIEKSEIITVSNIIKQSQSMIIEMSNEDEILKYPYNPTIFKSFENILKNKKIGDYILNRHYLSIVPKIYTNTYFEDKLLNIKLIEQIEYNIRENKPFYKQFEFYILKYDFYFLMNIQKYDNMSKITESKSYALGKNLGVMSKQFAAWRKDCPIKSFEKSYVGNLSRRISSIEELVKFSGFVNEKLTIHNRLYKDVKEAYLEMVEIINQFEGEKYNKHNCALGFFESYYKNDINEENVEQN
ncbi:MAG: hypothetical protein N4A49_04390 [Marinifilaceae bacterium]|jgi:hypothetical protein|nr:hypothetical protein [Marinifilaceae bacterium]